MNKMTLLLKALLLLLVGISGFIGYNFPREPKVEYLETIKEVPVEVIIERVVHEPYFVIQNVPVYVDRVKEVEKIVKTFVKLREFENIKELKEWLGGGPVLLIGENIDCDDYALYLQKRGMADGYFVSFEAITWQENNRLFKDKARPGEFHALNSVIIGNKFYYIEPQTNEVVLGAYLD